MVGCGCQLNVQVTWRRSQFSCLGNWGNRFLLTSTNSTWAGAQHSLQDCVCAQWRLRSAWPDACWTVFAVRMKRLWILGYPQSAMRRLWSDCADAQADLSLRWARMQYCRKWCAPAHIAFGLVYKRSLTYRTRFCVPSNPVSLLYVRAYVSTRARTCVCVLLNK